VDSERWQKVFWGHIDSSSGGTIEYKVEENDPLKKFTCGGCGHLYYLHNRFNQNCNTNRSIERLGFECGCQEVKEDEFGNEIVKIRSLN